MNKTYHKIERKFELLTEFATKILGNSITFIFAFCLVISWWATNLFASNNAHQNIGDIIFGITFLGLLIIQKSFNSYSAIKHFKNNELFTSHEHAKDTLMDTRDKSEREITNRHQEHIESVDLLDKELDNALKEINIENQI